MSIKPGDVAQRIAEALWEEPIGNGSTGIVNVEPHVFDVFVLCDSDDGVRIRVEFCDKSDVYAEDSLVIRDWSAV